MTYIGAVVDSPTTEADSFESAYERAKDRLAATYRALAETSDRDGS